MTLAPVRRLSFAGEQRTQTQQLELYADSLSVFPYYSDILPSKEKNTSCEQSVMAGLRPLWYRQALAPSAQQCSFFSRLTWQFGASLTIIRTSSTYSSRLKSLPSA